MASVNALRGLLVAGAAVVGVLAMIGGRWSVAALMVVGVAVHGLATVWLRQRRGASSAPPPAEGASADAGPG